MVHESNNRDAPEVHEESGLAWTCWPAIEAPLPVIDKRGWTVRAVAVLTEPSGCRMMEIRRIGFTTCNENGEDNILPDATRTLHDRQVRQFSANNMKRERTIGKFQ
jgi:hypothetical protein